MADLDTRVGAANEHWETLLRGAVLLLGAHGVGFAGCLTMLKDNTSIIPGVGVFICIFGSGLLFSALYYWALSINKIELLQTLVSGHSPDFTKGMTALAYIGLIGGSVTFVGAVLLAMYRFAFI